MINFTIAVICDLVARCVTTQQQEPAPEDGIGTEKECNGGRGKVERERERERETEREREREIQNPDSRCSSSRLQRGVANQGNHVQF